MSAPETSVRRGGGWVLPVLLVLLIAVPIIEVWLLIQVGSVIGVLPTIAILVAEALLGGWLMRREGGRAWAALNEAFGTGKMPTGELADAALILVGGVLLMLPGFVTDVFGFFFLLPFTRPLARKLLAFVVARRTAPDGPGADGVPPTGRHGDRGRDGPGSVAAGRSDRHRRRDRGRPETAERPLSRSRAGRRAGRGARAGWQRTRNSRRPDHSGGGCNSVDGYAQAVLRDPSR